MWISDLSTISKTGCPHLETAEYVESEPIVEVLCLERDTLFARRELSKELLET